MGQKVELKYWWMNSPYPLPQVGLASMYKYPDFAPSHYSKVARDPKVLRVHIPSPDYQAQDSWIIGRFCLWKQSRGTKSSLLKKKIYEKHTKGILFLNP